MRRRDKSTAPLLTRKVIHGVSWCVVLTGSEDPGCSCSWPSCGSTSLALFPPTSECSSCSTLVESSQPERRDSLCPTNKALLVLPPAVTLFLTTSSVNKFERGIVSSGSSEDTCCSCSWSLRGSTSLALFPTSECFSHVQLWWKVLSRSVEIHCVRRAKPC